MSVSWKITFECESQRRARVVYRGFLRPPTHSTRVKKEYSFVTIPELLVVLFLCTDSAVTHPAPVELSKVDHADRVPCFEL